MIVTECMLKSASIFCAWFTACGYPAVREPSAAVVAAHSGTQPLKPKGSRAGGIQLEVLWEQSNVLRGFTRISPTYESYE